MDEDEILISPWLNGLQEESIIIEGTLAIAEDNKSNDQPHQVLNSSDVQLQHSGHQNNEDENYEVLSDDGFSTDDEELEEVRQNVRRLHFLEREATRSEECDETISDEEYWNEEHPPSPPQYNSEEELAADANNTFEMVDPTFPVFNNQSRADQIQIELGMQFENNHEFKNAIDDYAIINGYDLRYIKNGFKYCKLVCDGISMENKPCQWFISTSWMQKKKNFQIISLGTEHICKRALHKNQRLSAKWLAKYYEERVKLTPSWRVREFKKTIWAELRLNVSLDTCNNALRKCKYKLEGDFRDHFKPLWDYAAEIKRANENNSVYLILKEGSNVFQSIYICFNALKQGWKQGCRPVIGLDGCFLKEFFEGQILSVVGIDGNNQMYPIAWAVVSRETEETWTWFLQHVITDLELNQGKGLTMRSDKQKGLINAISNKLPNTEHRCCARHVYANFRRKFGGLQYRSYFWSMANATTPNMYTDRLKKLREFDPKAADDLESRDPSQWSKAWFSLDSCCDSVTNNITEVRNGSIVEARRLPILGLLEQLREAPIKRMNVRRKLFDGKDMTVCPRILKLLATREEEAIKWSCLYTGMDGYEVKCSSNPLCDRYIVSIEARTCSCRSWQLSGIPCVHAICAIWEVRDKPENYVSNWYKKEAYMRAYSQYIEMLNGPNEWPRQGKPEVECPPLKIWKGRPKRKRRREAGEPIKHSKVSRKGQLQVCRACGVSGHNRLRCSNVAPSQTMTNMEEEQMHLQGIEILEEDMEALEIKLVKRALLLLLIILLINDLLNC